MYPVEQPDHFSSSRMAEAVADQLIHHQTGVIAAFGGSTDNFPGLEKELRDPRCREHAVEREVQSDPGILGEVVQDGQLVGAQVVGGVQGRDGVAVRVGPFHETPP